MNTAHPDFDVLATSQSQHHAIVIGSGFGGMASAIRLAAKGYRVTLLEKLDALGGRAYTYEQDGYTFRSYGRSATDGSRTTSTSV